MKKIAYGFKQRPQFYNAFDWLRTSPTLDGNYDLSLEEDFLCTTAIDEVLPGRNLSHFIDLEKDSDSEGDIASMMNLSPEDLWV